MLYETVIVYLSLINVKKLQRKTCSSITMEVHVSYAVGYGVDFLLEHKSPV